MPVGQGEKCRGAFQWFAGCAGELISHRAVKVPGLFLVSCESGKRGDNCRPALSTLNVHGPLLISAAVAAGLIQAIFSAFPLRLY